MVLKILFFADVSPLIVSLSVEQLKPLMLCVQKLLNLSENNFHVTPMNDHRNKWGSNKEVI